MQARIWLAAVFALTLATTGISVGFSFLGRDFYNALARKDQEQFNKQLLFYVGGFAVGIPFFVLQDYAKDALALRWRDWMTRYYIKRYLERQTFYKMQSQSIIDNPDQRIVDDLSSFAGTALELSLIIIKAFADLISYSSILYGIYPQLLLVLLAYSIGGTAISVYLGRGLVPLNFSQEKMEADFRYGLVRVRENAESIAFYGGERNEMQLLLQRFRSAFDNLTQLLISSSLLDVFTKFYQHGSEIISVYFVAPMYFSGKIEFGVISQSVSTYKRILEVISLIVYRFQALSAFSAVIDRLGEFDEVLDSKNSSFDSHSFDEICLRYCKFKSPKALDSNGAMLIKCQRLLDVDNLTLKTPTRKAILIKDLSFSVKKKDHLLVTGPSGSGKTSLLRALAGLWNTGSGKINFYINEGNVSQSHSAEDCTPKENPKHDSVWELNDLVNKNSKGIFFLPQRPYMVLGTLRQQLLYPTWTYDKKSLGDGTKQAGIFRKPDAEKASGRSDKPTINDLKQALENVRLGSLLRRFDDNLDGTCDWSSVLSLGEQQRLAFARLLLSKAKLVLLDESTSALDEATEAHFYHQMEAAGITYISIGHRQSLRQRHKRILHISATDPSGDKLNWHIEPIHHHFVAQKH